MTRPVTLSEPHFSQHTLNKYASLMAQGNGYLGLRASHEEDYTRQTRGMYLAGLYHRAGKGEINELVNLPDILGMEIAINGEVFSLSREAWQRELDFASGELRRSVVWRTSNGTGYTIASRRFVNGWLSMYKFANDLNTTGYADTRVETETGLQYTFNETVALRVNYYLERGFNMDDSRNNGEFSTQEIRAYLPLTLGNHSVTPYTRIGLDRWSNWDWQDDIEREGHDFNRVGLFYGYDFQNGLSVSLEYAFEWQDHDEGDSDKFHYAGVGVNYSF
ncbi:OmpG family monomeric porin [Escherichia coli]|uniref:OmpG family monomeric porin n=1 Tax=Escherichia coli TaxID=562 RepID=UPI000A189FE5|nr:OmpG family monomeric porin [Escherichia coli]OSK30647.1 outer membrane protein G [Escherichia coli B574]